MKILLVETIIALGLGVAVPAMAAPVSPTPAVALAPQLIAQGYHDRGWHHANPGRHQGWLRRHRHNNIHSRAQHH